MTITYFPKNQKPWATITYKDGIPCLELSDETKSSVKQLSDKGIYFEPGNITVTIMNN